MGGQIDPDPWARANFILATVAATMTVMIRLNR